MLVVLYALLAALSDDLVLYYNPLVQPDISLLALLFRAQIILVMLVYYQQADYVVSVSIHLIRSSVHHTAAVYP